jgi:hypothetical protein
MKSTTEMRRCLCSGLRCFDHPTLSTRAENRAGLLTTGRSPRGDGSI